MAHLIEGGAGEFGQADIAGGVVNHEGGIHAVDGNLAAGDFEGNLFSIAPDGDEHLGAGRTFHPPHHAVLRELDPGDDFVIDPEDAVARQEADFLGRSARNDFQDNGRVVGYVELDADAVEIAGQFGLGFLQQHRRHIDRVGIQFGQGGYDGRFREFVGIHRIHVALLDLVQDQIDLGERFDTDFARRGTEGGLPGQRQQDANQHAHQGHPN